MRILGGLALLWLLAAPAAAEDSARDYFDRATAQFALGKYEDAALNYEKCFELKPDPAILYNAAQAHRLGGNKARALELYQNYVRIYRTRIDNMAEVQRHIENLRAALAKDRTVSTSPPFATRSPAGTSPPAQPPPEPAKPKSPPAPPPKSATAVPPPKSATAVPSPKAPPPKAAPPPVAAPVLPPPKVEPAPQLVAAPPGREKPLIKKAWFWGVVAGAAVVVGTSIALGVTLGSPGTVDPPHSFGIVKAN